jgi:hypothetical protein
VPLQKIDEEMCAAFGVPVHPKNWCGGWYNSVGFRLAIGQSFAVQLAKEEEKLLDEQTKPVVDEIEVEYHQDQITIIKWLDANFISDSWVEIGRSR